MPACLETNKDGNNDTPKAPPSPPKGRNETKVETVDEEEPKGPMGDPTICSVAMKDCWQSN